MAKSKLKGSLGVKRHCSVSGNPNEDHRKNIKLLAI